MFVLEALKAKHGDCLLLHWGHANDPRLALIDGGPDGVYASFLRPRLEQLAAERNAARVSIDLAMVSHIDDDHINGLLDLATEMEAGSAPATIGRLWHNSLEGLLKSKLVTASIDRATASLGGNPPKTAELWYSKVLASVKQGQQLHGYAKRLGLHSTMNHPFRPLIAAKAGQKPAKIRGLSLRVISPSFAELETLRKAWKKKRDASILVAYKDPSPYNLSSIVVLAEYDGKRMLLTGDARGDHILRGLQEQSLLDSGGKIHVDLLKLPHHGSQNNVTRAFYEQITADIYVVSGDNKRFPNPHKTALKWLADARSGSKYEIYCTYDLPYMRTLFGDKLKVPKANANSLQVALSNPGSRSSARSADVAGPTENAARANTRPAGRPIVAVLPGDPNGIGPELTARLLAAADVRAQAAIVAIGDRRVLALGERVAGVEIPLHPIGDMAEARFAPDAIDLLDVPTIAPAEITPGKATAAGGRSAYQTLLVALRLGKAGQIDGFTFAPLNKKALTLGGSPFGDEHVLFAHELGHTGPYCEHNVLGELWTTRVTSHIPLKDVAGHITTDRVLAMARLAHQTLTGAGFKRPRIGVCALNPHAGDGGLFGREEIDVIGPAVEAARRESIDATGPWPPDTVFIKARDGAFDAVVTMYHDQGQIAMKLMGFNRGVTVSGGLPLPITTPASGTAFDIVGKGIASAEGLRQAFLLVCRMADARQKRAAAGAHATTG